MLIHSFARQLRKLPNWAEALIVLGAVFGPYLLSSFREQASPDSGSGEIEVTDYGLIWLVKWEVFLLSVVGLFLWLRGWKKEDLRVGISRSATVDGMKLWLITLGLYYALGMILMMIPAFEASANNVKFKIDVSFAAIVLLCVVNPIFEEVTTVAYVERRMAGIHPAVVILTSAGLRGIVHTYQGAYMMTMMVVFGIVFAWHFQKRGNLWPLIFAHAIFDFVGMIYPDDVEK